MQPPADFRSRVRAVRLESKSFLQAVRAERLARAREAALSPDPDMLPEPLETPAVDTAEELRIVAPVVQDAPDPSPLAVSALAARVSRLAQASAPPDQEPEPVFEPAVPETAAVANDPTDASDEAIPAEAEPEVAEIIEPPQDDDEVLIEEVPEPLVEAEVSSETIAAATPIMETETAVEPEVEVVAAFDAEPEPVEPELAVEPEFAVEPELDVEPELEAATDAAPPTTVAEAPVFHLLHLPPANASESDLNNLPGAGPGLVWMLQKLDIHSQADLARAHAEDLSTRMGLIGELLDLRGWIACAQRNVDACEPAPAHETA